MMHMPIFSSSCAHIPTEHFGNRRGIVTRRLSNSIKRCCLWTFSQNYEFRTAFTTYLLINKAHNFRPSSRPNIIRLNSSSAHQLATSLVHKLTSPPIFQLIGSPTHQFTIFDHIILYCPLRNHIDILPRC